MKFLRREVRVWGVVFVKMTNCGITKEDAAAAVRLESMFVRIDHDGVDLSDGVVSGPRLRRQSIRENKVATICSICMDAKFISLLQLQNLVERIDGSDSSRAQSDDDRPNLLRLKKFFEGGEIDA